jgi:L-alanine-DL-glutamate epimerase-like enolase superfamily enzyme
MSISSLSAQSLNIPFRQAFAHASAVRAQTESVLVIVVDDAGLTGIGEGCPRHYVTGESIESITQFVDAHRSQWMLFTDVDDLKRWMAANEDLINRNPAGWCAVELAFLDLFGKEANVSIEALVGVTPLSGRFQYSAVLGTDSLTSFEKQLKQYLAVGFTDFKVKVTGRLQEDIDKFARLDSAGAAQLRVRLDANNLWADGDVVIAYVKQLPGAMTAIEEPLKVGDYAGCRLVSQALGIPIILDESFLQMEQFQTICDTPSTWVINIRVSKMGGILRSLGIAKKAKELGIPIVVGAQVGETSVLTRAALTVANTYRDILIAQEGALGTHLLEHDICMPVLMFGKAGLLDPIIISGRTGLGLVDSRVIS